MNSRYNERRGTPTSEMDSVCLTQAISVIANRQAGAGIRLRNRRPPGTRGCQPPRHARGRPSRACGNGELAPRAADASPRSGAPILRPWGTPSPALAKTLRSDERENRNSWIMPKRWAHGRSSDRSRQRSAAASHVRRCPGVGVTFRQPPGLRWFKRKLRM